MGAHVHFVMGAHIHIPSATGDIFIDVTAEDLCFGSAAEIVHHSSHIQGYAHRATGAHSTGDGNITQHMLGIGIHHKTGFFCRIGGHGAITCYCIIIQFNAIVIPIATISSQIAACNNGFRIASNGIGHHGGVQSHGGFTGGAHA